MRAYRPVAKQEKYKETVPSKTPLGTRPQGLHWLMIELYTRD